MANVESDGAVTFVPTILPGFGGGIDANSPGEHGVEGHEDETATGTGIYTVDTGAPGMSETRDTMLTNPESQLPVHDTSPSNTSSTEHSLQNRSRRRESRKVPERERDVDALISRQTAAVARASKGSSPRGHTYPLSCSGFEMAKQKAQERIDEARAMQWSNHLPHAAAALAHREWAARERDAGGFSGVGGVGGMGGGGSGVLHGSFDVVQASRLRRGSPSRPSTAPSGPQRGGLSGMVRVVPLMWGDHSPEAEAGRKTSSSPSSSTPRRRTKRVERVSETPPELPSHVSKGRLFRAAPSSQKGRMERAALLEGIRPGTVEVGFSTSQRTGYSSPSLVYKTFNRRAPDFGVNGKHVVSEEKPGNLVYLSDGQDLQQPVSVSTSPRRRPTPVVSLTLPELHLLGMARPSTGKKNRFAREVTGEDTGVACHDMPRSFASPRGAGFGTRRNPPQTAAFAPDHGETSPRPSTYDNLGEDKQQKKTARRAPRQHSSTRPGSAFARRRQTSPNLRRPYTAYVPRSRSPNAVEWRHPHCVVPNRLLPPLRTAEVVGVSPATSPRPRHIRLNDSPLEDLPGPLNEREREEGVAVAAVQFDGPDIVEGVENGITKVVNGLVESELVELDAEDRNTTMRADDENNAALKIQAMQRGKAARAEVAKLKAEAAAKAADAGIAEAEAIAMAADTEAAAVAADITGTDEESAAALKIQSLQRGKAARARVEALKAGKAAAEAEATVFAADAETAAVAAEFTVTDDENKAALKIQAMQRGKAARAEFATLKAEAAAKAAEAATEAEREADADIAVTAEDIVSCVGKENSAALTIQAMHRGKVARVRVAKMKAEAAALAVEAEIAKAEAEVTEADVDAAMADTLTIGFSRTDEENAAALRIQAVHRGKAARAKASSLKAEKMAAAAVSPHADETTEFLVNAAVKRATARLEAAFESRTSQLEQQISQAEERARRAEARAAELAAQIAQGTAGTKA